jgi:hypothetical protein
VNIWHFVLLKWNSNVERIKRVCWRKILNFASDSCLRILRTFWFWYWISRRNCHKECVREVDVVEKFGLLLTSMDLYRRTLWRLELHRKKETLDELTRGVGRWVLSRTHLWVSVFEKIQDNSRKSTKFKKIWEQLRKFKKIW